MADTYDGFIGTTIAGRYELQSVLGVGGMGVVFRARQIAMNRVVAVKLLNAQYSSNANAVGRFEREMQASSRIEHPNTIRVYDYGSSDGHLFLAMELLPGRSLAKVLAEDGRMPVERIAKIGMQIAKALIAAHAEGVVHRDLKPDNVIVTDIPGERDFIKVLDFGIARFIDETQTQQLTTEGAVIGTPAYMSPEQVQGSAPDLRTDLYALGIILFEMVTGQVPFSAPTTLSLIVKHIKDAPPRPSDLAPNVSPKLERLILKCLEKERDARPADAAEVVRELESLAQSATTTVDLPPKDKRTALWAGLGVLLVAGIAIASYALSTSSGPPTPAPTLAPAPAPAPTPTLALAPTPAPTPTPALTPEPEPALTPEPEPAPTPEPEPADPRAALSTLFGELGVPDLPESCKTREPGPVEVLSKAARLIAGGGDSDALDLLDRYQGLLALSAEAHYLRARATLAAVQLPSEALAPAEASIARCDSAMARDIQGDVLRATGHHDEAKTAYLAANAREPEFFAPLAKAVQIDLDRERWDEAARLLYTFTLRHPEHVEAQLMRAEAFINGDHAQDALAAWSTPCRPRPTTARCSGCSASSTPSSATSTPPTARMRAPRRSASHKSRSISTRRPDLCRPTAWSAARTRATVRAHFFSGGAWAWSPSAFLVGSSTMRTRQLYSLSSSRP